MSRSNRILGSSRWDSLEDLPLTQFFESASASHQEDEARPSHNSELIGRQITSLNIKEENNNGKNNNKDDGVYENVAVIVVSSRRIIKGPNIEETKSCLWVRDYLESEESTDSNPPKPVDEDLYKIPPELLFSKPKKKTGLCYFSCCLIPACAF